MSRIICIAAAFGLIAPVVTLARHWLSDGYTAGAGVALAWPASLILLATEGQALEITVLAVLIAVLGNLLLYGMLGYLAALVLRTRNHAKKAALNVETETATDDRIRP